MVSLCNAFKLTHYLGLFIDEVLICHLWINLMWLLAEMLKDLCFMFVQSDALTEASGLLLSKPNYYKAKQI